MKRYIIGISAFITTFYNLQRLTKKKKNVFSLRIHRPNSLPHGGHPDEIWSNILSLSCRSSSCELLDCSWPRAAYLSDMPSPSSADHQGQPSIRTLPEPDVSEWSELLVNEQEVATVGGIVCMAASNAIELTPLWPKNHHSPLHHKGWPADHKGKSSGRGTAPQPPPLPSSCPPAVPSKSKNPPPAPPLPATSSREFRKQQETKRLANGLGQEQLAVTSNEIKGPAPQPPVLHPNSPPPVTSQPIRYFV